MQETELNLKDMLFCMLRKWRTIVIFAVICALIAGSVVAIGRYIDMNDEEKTALWESEYEAALGAYWAKISDLDRKIGENERLATQTEYELAHLEEKKGDYEAEIADFEAYIAYNESLIEDYRSNNEHLAYERELMEYYLTYRKEQNENSLLMKIDPYNVNVYEVYLRVDSGYEILPENTFQNIDRTAELLQTYRLLVGKTNFYNQMIADLKLNTEVRYLTEVISVSDYNVNSLCVRVMSDSASWAKAVGEYVSEAILAAHGQVSASIAEHELTKYNTVSYAAVDMNVYAQQQACMHEAFTYEEDIREVDTTMLNNEAAIRDMNVENRELQTQINALWLAIDNLPLEKQAMEDAIANYRDANYSLRQDQLKLRELPEPTYEGYTMVSVIVGFAKFAVLGGVGGAVITALCIMALGILSGKVISTAQLCEAVQCESFGFWPRTRKRAFGFIDRRIEGMAGNAAGNVSAEVAKNLVLANATVACGGMKKVMLCGGAGESAIAALSAEMKAQLPGVAVISGGTIDSDPAVVRGLAECDAVILIEQVNRSAMTAAVQLKNRAKALDKPVLGCVLIG